MSTPEEILAAHYAANPHVAAQLKRSGKTGTLRAEDGSTAPGSLLKADEHGPAIRAYEPAEAGLSSAVLNRVLDYTQSVVDDARVPHGSESMCRADARNATTFSPLTPRHRLGRTCGPLCIAVTLVSRRGKIVYCEGMGLQNDGTEASLTNSPVSLRPDTIFRI